MILSFQISLCLFLVVISFSEAIAMDGAFPSTTEGFGYIFNENGELKNINNGNNFVYEEQPGNPSYNQQRYEALGEVITEYVYNLLESKANLEKFFIPVEGTTEEPKSFVFVSKGFERKNRVLVLIHGSGVVRAGQWSRKLIINNSLDAGSQLPYIIRAQWNGFGVVVMNTNLVFGSDSSNKKRKIQGSGSPEEHARSVWRALGLGARQVALVAHSYGGVVALDLLLSSASAGADFRRSVFAAALTDSVHGGPPNLDPALADYIGNTFVNWVTSGEPLNKDLGTRALVPTRSAGTTAHEETSWKAIDSVWEYILRKWSEREKQEL